MTVSVFYKKTSNFDNITPLFYIIRKSLDKLLPHFDKIPQCFNFVRLNFNQSKLLFDKIAYSLLLRHDLAQSTPHFGKIIRIFDIKRQFSSIRWQINTVV
jgi:hypothetical protein